MGTGFEKIALKKVGRNRDGNGMAEVALRNVVKRYDDVDAVRSVNLDIPNQ